MLKGLMMDAPLSLIDVLDYGARIHRKAEIASVTVEGGLHRQSYGQTLERAVPHTHLTLPTTYPVAISVAPMTFNTIAHL